MQSLRIFPIAAVLLSACAIEGPDEDLALTPVATAESAVTTLPTFRTLSTVQNNHHIARPAGVMAGDFMLAALEFDADPVQITPPAGWSLVADQIAGAGTDQVMHALVYSHVASAYEPAEYAFETSNDIYVDVQIAVYTGVTQVDQVSSEGAFTETILAPNMFTTSPNQRLVSLFIGFEFGSWTVAPGMTQRSNFDANSLQDTIISNVGPTDKFPASCTLGFQAAVNLLLK